MSETQTAVPYHESTPTPENISDERLAGYLAGFGNSEGKSLLVLAMADRPEDTWFRETDLHNLLQATAPEAEIGMIRNQIGWCHDSLEPVGLVAKHLKDDVKTYELTHEGRVDGVPLAGFLLDVAGRHNVSLFQLFGGTQSRSAENRAAGTRLKIMRHIVDSGGIVTLNSLEEAIGSVNKQVIFSSLRTLDAAKFIEYNSWNPEQNTNRYTVIDMDYKPRKDADEISVMLKAYFTDHEEATLDEIVEHISEQNPASFTGEPARDRQLVSQHLNNMILRKRLGRLEHKHAMEHVDVNLTEEQLSFWVELLDGLERIQSGDAEFLKYYRQRAREIVRDPEACTKALKTYREQSPNVKNSDTPDAMAIVLGILKNRADGLSVRQTIEDLKASKMRTLSTFGARNALNGLVELGLVETTPGKVKTYRLTQPDESHTEVGADAEGERIS